MLEIENLQEKIDSLILENEKLRREYHDLEQVHEKQALYNRMLYDNSPDDIVILDKDLRVLFCTASVQLRFDHSLTGEWIMPFVARMYSDDFASKIEETILEVMRTRKSMVFNCERVLRKSCSKVKGTEYVFSFQFTPAIDKRGELIGIIVLAHDETEMYNAIARAEAAARAKSSFLANMSHEIRTPLNAIIGMTSIGKATTDVDRKDYCYKKIEIASNHLLGVINDVLDMSKIEADRFDISPVEFEFEKMLQCVANMINFRIDEKKQKFTVSIDRRIPNALIGDDQRLMQIVMNLLGNAVKFTPEGGAIGLNAHYVGEENGHCTIQIEVSDSGIGISPEQQALLFNSFQQATINTSRNYGGTGLGLAISKKIVDMMGGRIWIESELGKGAVFAFTIRIKKGKARRRNQIHDANWKNVKILVIDNDQEILLFVKELLHWYGVDCDIAHDDEEALTLVEKNGSYDISFVDWKMPGIDGLGLTRVLKERDVGNKSIVVFMVSSAEWQVIENDAKEAGVDKYITKPLFPSDICDCITEYLGVGTSQSDDEKHDGELTFEGRRILLAEDVEINREIVQALLEPTQIEINYAVNGAEAVRMFTEEPEKYEMIFMDLQMPEMDGFEATQLIRSSGALNAKSIPIVAMTANVFKEDVEKCLDTGMDSHIGKPLNIDEVLNVLSLYLPRTVTA